MPAYTPKEERGERIKRSRLIASRKAAVSKQAHDAHALRHALHAFDAQSAFDTRKRDDIRLVSLDLL